jgi:hypothetical protein
VTIERPGESSPVGSAVLVIALLTPVAWSPPGVDPAAWRTALAEDVVDLLAPLPQVEAAIAGEAADLPLARSIGWPSMKVYELEHATLRSALLAASAAGHERAAVIFADAPDLPAMLIGKLVRPLTTRPVAVAPAVDGGLLGIAANLPVPEWLPDLDGTTGDARQARAGAPSPTLVASSPAWHRMRGPLDLRRLDPALDGWEATRALLS